MKPVLEIISVPTHPECRHPYVSVAQVGVPGVVADALPLEILRIPPTCHCWRCRSSKTFIIPPMMFKTYFEMSTFLVQPYTGPWSGQKSMDKYGRDAYEQNGHLLSRITRRFHVSLSAQGDVWRSNVHSFQSSGHEKKRLLGTNYSVHYPHGQYLNGNFVAHPRIVYASLTAYLKNRSSRFSAEMQPETEIISSHGSQYYKNGLNAGATNAMKLKTNEDLIGKSARFSYLESLAPVNFSYSSQLGRTFDMHRLQSDKTGFKKFFQNTPGPKEFQKFVNDGVSVLGLVDTKTASELDAQNNWENPYKPSFVLSKLPPHLCVLKPTQDSGSAMRHGIPTPNSSKTYQDVTLNKIEFPSYKKRCGAKSPIVTPLSPPRSRYSSKTSSRRGSTESVESQRKQKQPPVGDSEKTTPLFLQPITSLTYLGRKRRKI